MESELIVLKLGGSVLANEDDLGHAVHEIYRHHRAGCRVLAVVSALRGATDRLLAQARRVGDDLAPHGVAALLATGETSAAALLVVALDRAGVPAQLVDPRQAGLRTAGAVLDADPVDVDAAFLRRRLERRVVVMPGFFGAWSAGAEGDEDVEEIDDVEDGGVALLGRGGSDLTALFLAHRLGPARCLLVKDVDGIYERDPAGATVQAPSRRYATLSWADAAGLEARVVQAKALAFAALHGVAFGVAAAGREATTEVGPYASTFADDEASALAAAPLRVVLLGLGTVGGGVYRHLLADAARFTVVGIGVRDGERHRAAGVPGALLSTDPWELIERPCDVVVEALPGSEPAARLVAASLSGGRHVVTANKAVMAEEGEWLARLAAAQGARLRWSAAVGGGVPMVEAVARAAAEGRIVAVEGVLNGTCNFVLDRMAAGSGRAAAVRLAQEKGFAEADPARDLDGRDAACKLRVLVRAAFGVELAAEDVERRGLDEVDDALLAEARDAGRVVRLVAACERRPGGGVRATVAPRLLPATHFLAGARGEENRVAMERAGAPPLRLAGRGAGRWPTSESMMADLYDLARLHARRPPSVGEAAPRAAAAAGVRP